MKGKGFASTVFSLAARTVQGCLITWIWKCLIRSKPLTCFLYLCRGGNDETNKNHRTEAGCSRKNHHNKSQKFQSTSNSTTLDKLKIREWTSYLWGNTDFRERCDCFWLPFLFCFCSLIVWIWANYLTSVSLFPHLWHRDNGAYRSGLLRGYEIKLTVTGMHLTECLTHSRCSVSAHCLSLLQSVSLSAEKRRVMILPTEQNNLIKYLIQDLPLPSLSLNFTIFKMSTIINTT